ncbi:MAG: PAS domain S-box protein [Thermodesulfobacteriota bacterium]
MSRNKSSALDRGLLRLVLLRLFLPLLVLSFLAIAGLGYYTEQTLEVQQRQMAQSVAQMVDRYLDQAGRMLDAIARIAEVSKPEDLAAFIQGAWEAYGYYDTLYYLDDDHRIELLAPPDPRYLGLDVSNLPYLQKSKGKKILIISRPFMSLRTGDPTVYLIRPLSRKGAVVGELSLGALQYEITRRRDRSSQDYIFILDQFGTLLAHPSSNLVKQQTNLGNLEIFKRSWEREATLVYEYAGTRVLGSAVLVERAGWVVVDQVPLTVAFGPYASTLLLTLLASLIIWLALVINLRKQLQRHIVTPLVQLSRETTKLAMGDFSPDRMLAALPATFIELNGLVADFQNMSQALQTRQTALRESEERYRGLFDRVPAGLYRTTPAGQILEANAALVHMLGYPSLETLSAVNTARIYVRTEDRIQLLIKLEQDGVVHDFETQMRRHDGTIIWVRDNSRVVLDPGGRLQYYEGILEDITGRKLAEEEQVRLTTAIEQCAEGIFLTDTNWIIQYVNPAFERITGYAGQEITNQHSRILQSGKHDRAFYRNIRDTLKRGEVWSGRVIGRKKDGTFYDAEVAASPVRNKSGEIINFVGIHRDITHEVKLENSLRQAQKMEAIGRLAGGIAHDFNNILLAITGYTELALRKASEGSPISRELEQVLLAGHRAADLVKQILAFSRQADQIRKPTPLAPIVWDALKLLRSTLPSTIEIRQDSTIPPGRGIVLADPIQIHQVLMNLCGNAAQAMRATGGVLSVSLSEVEADASLIHRYPDLRSGRYARLTVSDTGHGMDAAVMERIFEPYFTTKEPGEGTGLGLAVVLGIVKSHGGAIVVYSEPGKGTTFHVFLPETEDRIAPETVPEEALPTGSERLLFVDDETALVHLGKEMLESLGYDVVARTSSLEALETFRLQAGAFNLVITDMTMPGLTGMELAKELMALRPDIPIILCTGFSELINGKAAKEAGIREFIMKPYSATKLAQNIRKVLDES